MLLQLQSPYKSILQLEEVRLPSFSVITGLNGSGKTQLLEAIMQGNIAVAGVSPADMHLFTISDFGVSKTNVAPFRSALSGSIKKAWEGIQGQTPSHDGLRRKLGPLWSRLQEICSQRSLSPDFLEETNLSDIASEGPFGSEDIAAIRDYNRSIMGNLNDVARSGQEDVFGIVYLARFLGKGLQRLDDEDLARHQDLIMRHAPSKIRALDTDISIAFRAYHYRWLKNFLNAKLDGAGHTHNPYLTEEQFLRKYGDKPWLVLNRLIQRTQGLSYEFSHPDGPDFEAPFEARLINKDNGVPVSVTDLSSGEKVLLKIAVSLYLGEELPASYAAFPKLLLLDEVDATLHPTMIGNLLQLLQEELQKKHGTLIILTTHSPTTVALAPENSLHLMNNRLGKLIKKSKMETLDSLCEGIVRVDESKKIVLVEANDDKTFYELTFKKLIAAKAIAKRPTLLFVAPADDAGGKKEVEKRSKLAAVLAAKNYDDLVCGLRDWDGEDQEIPNVHKTARWELQNYLFDPILIAAAGLSQGKWFSDVVTGFGKEDAFRLHEKLDAESMQRMADDIVESVRAAYEGQPSKNCAVEIRYINNHIIKVPGWWCRGPGKTLAKAAYAAFSGSVINRQRLLEVYGHCSFVAADLRDIFSQIQGSVGDR